MIETITKPEEFERFGCVLVQNFLDPMTTQNNFCLPRKQNSA